MSVDEEIDAVAELMKDHENDQTLSASIMMVKLLGIIARDCRRIADATEQETKQVGAVGPR